MAQNVAYSTIAQRARDWNYNGVYAKDSREIEACIRSALEQLVGECHWPFYQKIGHIQTVAPITITGSVGATDGSDTVTSADAATAHIGKYIRIAGQSKVYKITNASAGVSWTLDRAYVGDAVSSGNASIETPNYDLPSDIELLKDILDLDTKNDPLPEVEWWELQYYLNENASSGQAQAYALQHDASDQDSQIWFWPVPDSKREYQLLYYRKAALPDKASPSTVLDWPDSHRMLFEAAVEREIARLHTKDAPGWYATAQAAYMTKLVNAKAKARKSLKPRKLGRTGRPHGRVWWRI